MEALWKQEGAKRREVLTIRENGASPCHLAQRFETAHRILIELAELLFEEWYVAREQRTKRIQKLGEIAAGKKELQQQKQLSASAESSATTA